MAKGQLAKQNVIDKIRSAFGTDFIGEYDKKIYVWANDGGESVQIAISLTCPKAPVMVADAPVVGDFNFEDDAPNTVVAATAFQPAEITQEEKDTVAKLMADLGL